MCNVLHPCHLLLQLSVTPDHTENTRPRVDFRSPGIDVKSIVRSYCINEQHRLATSIVVCILDHYVDPIGLDRRADRFDTLAIYTIEHNDRAAPIDRLFGDSDCRQ